MESATTDLATARIDLPSWEDGVVRGGEAAALAALYDPEVLLVTAPVPLGLRASEHAAALAEGPLGRSPVQVPVQDGVPSAGRLEDLALRDRADAPAWVAYLEEVTTLFATLLGARVVGVRQIVSEGPHCPRVHVDRVPARGVVNVLGERTEWVGEGDVDRTRLGHAGGADDATSGLLRPGARLQRAETGTLAVFKGTAWPGAEERAVVHRSPPADGARRLLLTLDWVE